MIFGKVASTDKNRKFIGQRSCQILGSCLCTPILNDREQGFRGFIIQINSLSCGNAFEDYYQSARRIFERENWGRTDVAVAQWEPEKVLVLANDRHWTLEEHPDEKIVVLRRSPLPVEDIDELMASNETIIAQLDPRFADYGVIVDIREAPR